MTKVIFAVPFFKTTAQTIACSAAQVGGAAKNAFCNGIRNPRIRISIFSDNPPIVSKKVVEAPQMNRL